MSAKIKKSKGQYYTNENPFKLSVFNDWMTKAINESKNKTILEPFAGSNNIPKMLSDFSFDSFDISPDKNSHEVMKRDTIKDFPEGYDLIITNPPYLEKSSAKRYDVPYNKLASEERNLYIHCLKLMNSKSRFVAAIVPASFKMRYKKFPTLTHIIDIKEGIFTDTSQEVVLVLFDNIQESEKILYFFDKDKFIDVKKLEEYIPQRKKDEKIKITFNSDDGQIGFKAIDSSEMKAHFKMGKEINEIMKVSSRNITKIKIEGKKISNKDIENLNINLNTFRKKTLDFFSSSFHNNNIPRKRINYKIVRWILEDYYG